MASSSVHGRATPSISECACALSARRASGFALLLAAGNGTLRASCTERSFREHSGDEDAVTTLRSESSRPSQRIFFWSRRSFEVLAYKRACAAMLREGGEAIADSVASELRNKHIQSVANFSMLQRVICVYGIEACPELPPQAEWCALVDLLRVRVRQMPEGCHVHAPVSRIQPGPCSSSEPSFAVRSKWVLSHHSHLLTTARLRSCLQED